MGRHISCNASGRGCASFVIIVVRGALGAIRRRTENGLNMILPRDARESYSALTTLRIHQEYISLNASRKIVSPEAFHFPLITWPDHLQQSFPLPRALVFFFLFAFLPVFYFLMGFFRKAIVPAPSHARAFLFSFSFWFFASSWVYSCFFRCFFIFFWYFYYFFPLVYFGPFSILLGFPCFI